MIIIIIIKNAFYKREILPSCYFYKSNRKLFQQKKNEHEPTKRMYCDYIRIDNNKLDDQLYK